MYLVCFFFHIFIITFTLTSHSLSNSLHFTAFYKEIKFILSWIEFSLLVQPSTTVPVSYVALWENELPTPVLKQKLATFPTYQWLAECQMTDRSNMSGSRWGLQASFKDIQEEAMDGHCNAHNINTIRESPKRLVWYASEQCEVSSCELREPAELLPWFLHF